MEEEEVQARGLEPYPIGVAFEPELENLCRVAASVGGKQTAPISYTALVIAMLFWDDPVSKWFQSYVTSAGIDLDPIFRSKGVTPRDRDHHIGRASSGALPNVDPLYSRSVRNLLDQAVRVVEDVAPFAPSSPHIAARHVMAAYAFRNPSDHVDQVRGWGFDAADWQAEFLRFAQEKYPEERWSVLADGGVRPFATTVSSFTADDPRAPTADLLGVESEAAAFARLAAARAIQPPLAIGIFGEWGSGKTYFMRRIHEHVDHLAREAAAQGEDGLFHADIVQIRFNAWHYIETNLWASLVEYIFAELDRWLLAQAGSGREQADLVFDRLATAQQLKLDALEEVVSRRAERTSAELRAQHARRAFEEALALSQAVGLGTYAKALLDEFLKDEDVARELTAVGDALGTPSVVDSSARVIEVLEQARSEAGRARLVMRSGIAQLGTWPWIGSAVAVLVVLPLVAVGLKAWAADLLKSDALRSIHETVVAAGTLIAGLAAWGGLLVRRAAGALRRIDALDKSVRARIEAQVGKARHGDAALRKQSAEEQLGKRRQALDAAERALSEADARLNEARQEFQSATARNRLNAFIRAKATDGDYAKHLGVIAAIRRDFGQLAALMGAADDSHEQKAESDRLREQGRARVVAFLVWLGKAPDIRLTQAELRSLLSLVEPLDALAILDEHRAMLAKHLEPAEADLTPVRRELEEAAGKTLPKFSRIVLYIDDLDRCPPKTVVSVLQAVHLLLCFPLFTVVVAVDARWVSRALKEEFPNLLTGTGASSHDYLEKIFQIPYWVRPIDPVSAARYVGNLVESDVRNVARGSASGTDDASSDDRGGDADARDDARRSSDAPTPPPMARPPAPPRTTGLELTRWESDTLERFAPLVGATPRRLIRFVNVYRLIKTSLPEKLLDGFVGEEGEGLGYRSLIAQLAIVTGAPDASMAFFGAMAGCKASESLQDVVDRLKNDRSFRDCVDSHVIEAILRQAIAEPGAALRVEHMAHTAVIARRYSFTARPH